MFGFLEAARLRAQNEPKAQPDIRFKQGDRVRVSYIGTVRQTVYASGVMAVVDFVDGVFESVPVEPFGPDGPFMELLAEGRGED